MAYHHFGVAKHLVVERISFLYGVKNLAFLIFAWCRNGCYGLMTVGIERVVGHVELLHTILFKILFQLVVNEPETLNLFRVGIFILGSCFQTAFKIVDNRQQTIESLFAAILYKLGFFADCAFAEIVEVRIEQQIFILFFLLL